MIQKSIQSRILGIDALRGISILLVIFLHINIHFDLVNSNLKEVLHPRIFNGFFWSGYYGVVIFFTLSGYLITTTILKRWNEPNRVQPAQYYWLRFSRIIPTLIALLAVLSIFHLLGVKHFVISPEKTSLPRALLAALTFHINWLELKVGYLPGNWDVLWTISIEEVFYFILPLCCIIFRKRWMLVSVLILFLIVGPWSRMHPIIDSDLNEKNGLDYVDCISYGCLAALLIPRIKIRNSIAILLGIVGVIIIAFILFYRGYLFKWGVTDYGLDLTILSIGVCLYIVSCVKRSKKAKTFLQKSTTWLQSMGKYSYEIYLTHMFVVFGVLEVSNFLEMDKKYIIAIIIVITIICYILGYIVFNYFSEPMNQKLRKNVHFFKSKYNKN